MFFTCLPLISCSRLFTRWIHFPFINSIRTVKFAEIPEVTNTSFEYYHWNTSLNPLGYFIVQDRNSIIVNWFINTRSTLPLLTNMWIDYNDHIHTVIETIAGMVKKNTCFACLSIFYLWCWLEKGRWTITQVYVTSSNMTKLLVYTAKSQ